MDFVVGIPTLGAEQELLIEALDSVFSGNLRPTRVFVIENGPIFECMDANVSVIRPVTNLGVSGSWNLIHKLAQPLPVILVNDDTAVASDTFVRMMAEPGPAIVCAWGYNCVRIDHEVWKQVGDFDEEFYPGYYEDADHRRRCRIAGVKYVEWDPEPSEEVSPGRRRSAQGLVHGKPDYPGRYQCWSGASFDWFRDRLEANKKYYEKKWGGGVECEIYRRPFGK